jgi:DNA primase
MTVRDVLDRTDLASVLTELSGEPAKRGRLTRWHCCAADHPDEHPSVTMFRDRHGVERWRCWSGGHGGTAIDAVILARGVTTAEAIRCLEQRAGITPTIAPVSVPRVIAQPAEHLSVAARDYAQRCAVLLWTPAGRAALDWLHQRGLPDAVWRANLVGYDPGPTALTRAKGLARYCGVTYPSFDAAGDMIYVQTRYLDPAAPNKYANPAARHGPLPAVSYPRGARTLEGPMIVTEGVPDGLVAIAAGFRAAAVISASVSNPVKVAAELARHAGPAGVVLAFDNDPAGRIAEAQLHTHLDGHTPVRVLRLGEGLDLTDTYHRSNQWHQKTQNNSATASIN